MNGISESSTNLFQFSPQTLVAKLELLLEQRRECSRRIGKLNALKAPYTHTLQSVNLEGRIQELEFQMVKYGTQIATALELLQPQLDELSAFFQQFSWRSPLEKKN